MSRIQWYKSCEFIRNLSCLFFIVTLTGFLLCYCLTLRYAPWYGRRDGTRPLQVLNLRCIQSQKERHCLFWGPAQSPNWGGLLIVSPWNRAFPFYKSLCLRGWSTVTGQVNVTWKGSSQNKSGNLVIRRRKKRCQTGKYTQILSYMLLRRENLPGLSC